MTPGTGAGNVISGNTGDGVDINGSGTTGNVVAGNLIGTDVTGDVALGNASSGVYIATSASDNIIGGTTASARNIISANEYSGVEIFGANDNLVEGDYIGTDITGTVALGNNQGSGTFGFADGGVAIEAGTASNTIGGLTATPGNGAGNLVSGNTFAGVLLYGAGSNNLVVGNLIGTDVTGTVALGNLIDPVVNFGGAGVGVEYSPGTIVGEPGGRNVISGNGGDWLSSLYFTSYLLFAVARDDVAPARLTHGGVGRVLDTNASPAEIHQGIDEVSEGNRAGDVGADQVAGD